MQRYSDTFFFFCFNSGDACLHRFASHALVYVYGGQLKMDGRGLTIPSGESLFVKKGCCLRMVAGNMEEKTEVAILRIPDNLLREFYFVTDRQEIRDIGSERMSFPIPKRADIDSLFLAMRPYLDANISPQDAALRLKAIEAIYALLDADRMFYSILFGFAATSNISISDLLLETCIAPFYWQKMDEMDFELHGKPN